MLLARKYSEPMPEQSPTGKAKRKEFHAYGKLGGLLGRRDFLAAIEDFEGEQCHVFIEVANRRTTQANRYYWGMLSWISKEIGEYPDKLHEMNKEDFNPQIRYVQDRRTGEVLEKKFAGDTRRMKVGEFAEFVERCRQGWAERGYAIPDEYWDENN
jgi:hypothetical protein